MTNLEVENHLFFYIVSFEYSVFKENEKRYNELSYLLEYYGDLVPVGLSDKLTPSFLKYVEKINTKGV